MTVEEARAKGVCRICGLTTDQVISPEEFRKRASLPADTPYPDHLVLVMDGRSEYAHRGCLHGEQSSAKQEPPETAQDNLPGQVSP